MAGETSERAKPGPASIKSPELMEEICRRIAEGRSVKNVCNDEDMPSFGFVWRWISEDAVFEHRYARAIQQRALNHADEIIEIEQQVRRGEITPDVARVALDARKWTASRLLPKVYGDKQIVEANVTHTHQLHLDALKALTSRRSGNDRGYIEAQAIDITDDQTFSGERRGADMGAIVDGSDVNRIDVNDLDPPGPGIVPGAASAPATSPRTRKKRSDPPPPPAGGRKPRAPKKFKKRDGEK